MVGPTSNDALPRGKPLSLYLHCTAAKAAFPAGYIDRLRLARHRWLPPCWRILPVEWLQPWDIYQTTWVEKQSNERRSFSTVAMDLVPYYVLKAYVLTYEPGSSVVHTKPFAKTSRRMSSASLDLPFLINISASFLMFDRVFELSLPHASVDNFTTFWSNDSASS